MADLDLGQALRERLSKVSFHRSDAKQDAYAEVRRARGNDEFELPDYTQKFLNAVRYPIPTTGRVIFLNIPVFASPGLGKTVTALTVTMNLMDFYGRDKVSVYISDHLPSLADALRDKATPVQVLIVDDALKNYTSRAGGNAELLEAIELFTTLRHEFEEAQGVLNGIVFVMFTSQMYKGLDKVFREGFPIFKCALTSDKEEIMSATKMGNRAWEYLNKIVRDVMVHHRESRMADSVVILPGYPAGRTHLPMRKAKEVNELLQHLAAQGDAGCLEALKEGDDKVAVKYKAIERAWTIKRRKLTKEEKIARLNRLMDELAAKFVAEREEDTGTNEGKAALRSWLDRRAYGLDVAPGERLASEDYLDIKVPANFKAIGEKAVTQRKKSALKMLEGDGLPKLEGADGQMQINQLLDYVAQRLLDGGFDPTDKNDLDRYQSLLYKLPSSIRNDAIKERTAILSRMRDIALGGGYGFRAAKEAKVREIVEKAQAKVDSREYFQLDAKQLLEDLIENTRKQQDFKLWRKLMVFRACEHKLVYADKVIGDPTVIADTSEGQGWQKEVLGETKPLSRPQIQKDKQGGSSYFHNQVGLAYEHWVEAKLKAGFIIKGVFDRGIIAKIERGGGNDHDPDIVVTYNDGRRDYVSLKCYNTSEPITITSNPEKDDDEIKPERLALQRDEDEGVTDGRLVILCRNLHYDGLQGVAVYERVKDIKTTTGFNKTDIGTRPWVAGPRVQEADSAGAGEVQKPG